MKNKIFFAVGSAILLAATVLISVYVNNGNDSMKTIFDANVEALARSEGSPGCTGPKKENVLGNIFCRSENTAPCKDMYGCN